MLDERAAVRERPSIRERAGWLAAGAWLVVYLVVWVTGQQFDGSYLTYGWQLVPWETLSARPIQSVWYLHVQPPLWNLVLGGSAKLSPFPDGITLQVVLAACGAAGAAAAALIARRCHLGVGASVAVAVVATANPEVLRNAFEPRYETATATLLLVVVAILARFATEPGWRRGPLLLAIAGTAVVLTRSLYHPVWLAGLLVVALVLARRHLDRRQVLAALAVPALLVGGWMLKNQALYGRATLSSWFGMNLQRAVIPPLDRADLEAMHAAGDVSDIALIGPFEAYERYAPAMPPCSPGHDDPSVDVATRRDSNSPNFNYECYLPVFDRAGDDAWAVIREHPGAFVEGRLWSARTYWAVDSGATTARSDSLPMRLLNDLYSVLRVDYPGEINEHGFGTPIFGGIAAEVDFGIAQALAYAGVAAGAVWGVWWWRRRDGEATDRDARAAVLVASAYVAGFTFLVGITGELGEQARFRTMTDPLVWVAAGVVVVHAAGRRRGARTVPSPDTER